MEGSGDILETRNDGIGGGAVGDPNFGWKPYDGIANAGLTGFPNPNAVATVGIHGGAKIPAVEAVGRPGFAVFGFFVGYDAAAWWTERCAVEIEGTVDLGVGGKLGVDT